MAIFLNIYNIGRVSVSICLRELKIVYMYVVSIAHMPCKIFLSPPEANVRLVLPRYLDTLKHIRKAV